MIHELKCWPEYFEEVYELRKLFEIREKRDRDFKVDDVLHLREWDPTTEKYSGREVRASVTYMTNFEQKPGYVVMSIRPFQANDAGYIYCPYVPFDVSTSK